MRGHPGEARPGGIAPMVRTLGAPAGTRGGVKPGSRVEPPRADHTKHADVRRMGFEQERFVVASGAARDLDAYTSHGSASTLERIRSGNNTPR